ncbi:MAG: Hsp33 family molecular chaperone HslO [Lachnospiraceae bacterium]|nr:Hsp33 family molecular chaperone HslO [Lachnospiraceae bacterium]
MSDRLIHGLSGNKELRFVAAYTRDTVEEARRIHNTSPLCSAALGRLLTAGVMMGSMCKSEEDLINLKIDGDGPIRQITVSADPQANVKGLMYDPSVELPLKANGHLDVGGGIGSGMLTVMKDLGLKEPYTGQTPLTSGEIGDDLTYYFAVSEQTPSAVGVGVLVDTDGSIKHAGGFIIQLMPFASEETISMLEKTLAGMSSVTDHFAAGETLEDIMRGLLGDIEVEGELVPRYHCNCSRDRVTKALISLGRDELDKMIAEGKPVTLHCDFCNKDYVFETDEIKKLIKN